MPAITTITTTTVAPSVLLEYRLQKQINLFAFTNKSPLLLFHFCSVFVIHFSLFFFFFCVVFASFYWSFARISTSAKEFAVNGENVNEPTQISFAINKENNKNKNTWERAGEKEEERVENTICPFYNMLNHLTANRILVYDPEWNLALWRKIAATFGERQTELNWLNCAQGLMFVAIIVILCWCAGH